MIRWLVAVCFGLAFVAVSGAVAPRAAYADDVATRTAKRHFDRGVKLFNVGNFQDALDEYKKAYEAKPIPAFLYNIGQCYRNLGDLDEAVFAYKKYLELQPDADNREQVQRLIDDLDAKIDAKHQQEAAHTADDGGSTPVTVTKHATAPASTPVYKKWWFWTGVVLVGAAGGVGIFEATHGGAPSTDLNPPINFSK